MTFCLSKAENQIRLWSGKASSYFVLDIILLYLFVFDCICLYLSVFVIAYLYFCICISCICRLCCTRQGKRERVWAGQARSYLASPHLPWWGAATSPLTQAQAHPLPPLPLLLLPPDPFGILDTCDSFPLRSDLRPQSTNPGSRSHAAVASLSNLQNLRKSEVAKKKLHPRSRMPRMTLLVVVQQWRKQQNSPCRFLTIRPLFAESIHTKGAEGRPAARCGTK